MDDLHFYSQLPAVVADDQDANGAATGLESLIETIPEV
jgi:hypothetical protein